MAFMTVKLTPGVHAEQTPLLLQAGIVQSNLIRWRNGLPEKFGGWRKFYYIGPGDDADSPTTARPIVGIVREMWPWADFNGSLHLAVGGDGGLNVITDGVTDEGLDITPKFIDANIRPNGTTLGFTTASGSNVVHVLGVDDNLTQNLVGSIVINNYVSVGGLILYGPYAVQVIVTPTEIEILAANTASASVIAGGTVSTFTTEAETPICVVKLTGHGFGVGKQVAFVRTTLPGSSAPGHADVVVDGAYEVLAVIDANTFTIGLETSAVNGVGPIAENGGAASVTYWVVQSPLGTGGVYGADIYGSFDYGTPHSPVPFSEGTEVTAANLGVSTLDWCLTNFGEQLIAQPDGQGFFRWTVNEGYLTAQPIVEAPAIATGFFLAMPQQQLVAYGASTGAGLTQDTMLVRWCDNANYRVWKAAPDNQAGSFRLARGSRIVGAIQSPMQAMLWTDIGFWLMTYIGYPDVWGFNEVAQECGLIAKKAVGVCGTQTFWMSRDKFWTFVGGQVQPLPCEIWDAIYQNLNLDLIDLIRCGTNSGFDEVTWYYPSLATGILGALQENDSYVKFNRVTGEWDYGTPIDVFGQGSGGGLMVSDWIDFNVFGHPISAMTLPDGETSQLMWHEMGRDADTEAMDWWFRTGLFLLSEGEDFIFVDRCRPDFRWRKFGDDPATASANIQVTLYGQDESDNPLKPPVPYGPFTCTSSSGPFDPRARGRYFSLKVEGNDVGSFARMGGVKFRFSPDGRAG